MDIKQGSRVVFGLTQSVIDQSLTDSVADALFSQTPTLGYLEAEKRKSRIILKPT